MKWHGLSPEISFQSRVFNLYTMFFKSHEKSDDREGERGFSRYRLSNYLPSLALNSDLPE
jgi:hypothetical protein